MMLDVRDALKNPGQSYPLAAEISLEPMDVLYEVVAFEDVTMAGQIVGAGESVRLMGVCRARLRAHCALCLCEVEMPIEVEFDEVFAKNPDVSDPDQYPLEGYEVALNIIAKDVLLLELPMRFVCGANCRGLCPSCGTNRNHQRCTCHEGRASKHPLAALSELLTEDEEV